LAATDGNETERARGIPGPPAPSCRLISSAVAQQHPLAADIDVEDPQDTAEVSHSSSVTASLAETIVMRTVAGMRGHPDNVHQVTAALGSMVTWLA
jgi:hypothetical protein